jgi:hypothetical protein
MGKNTEKLIYDMAFRVRLYIASKISEQKVGDLTDRETLILELVGMQGNMSISILPENQRVTTVSLTDKGRQVLEEIKRTQSEVFSTVTVSLGLTPDQVGHFHDLLENAIGFFDETLGLNLDDR